MSEVTCILGYEGGTDLFHFRRDENISFVEHNIKSEKIKLR